MPAGKVKAIDTETTVLISGAEAMNKTVDEKLLKQFDGPINLSRAGLNLSLGVLAMSSKKLTHP